MEQIKLLVLRLTERCNLRCTYCYAARPDDALFDMPVETALRAVELCCPVGGRLRIQFTGGEPLLRLEVMEAVAAYGRETGRKLTLSVQTNGTLLTPETCRRLNAMRCGMGVSLDGMGQANSLRVFPDGSPSLDAVLQGIRNLGQVGMQCGLNTVITRVNADQLGKLPDLALYLGNVMGVGLDLFRPMGRGAQQELSPDPAALRDGLTALRRRTDELNAAGIPFRQRELNRIRKRLGLTGCGETYCYAQTNASLAVDGRGDCWPCSSLTGQPGYLLGNIRDGLPQCNCRMEDLAAPASCRGCDVFYTCLGGCPAGRAAAGSENRLTCVMHRALAENGG